MTDRDRPTEPPQPDREPVYPTAPEAEWVKKNDDTPQDHK